MQAATLEPHLCSPQPGSLCTRASWHAGFPRARAAPPSAPTEASSPRGRGSAGACSRPSVHLYTGGVHQPHPEAGPWGAHSSGTTEGGGGGGRPALSRLLPQVRHLPVPLTEGFSLRLLWCKLSLPLSSTQWHAGFSCDKASTRVCQVRKRALKISHSCGAREPWVRRK